MTRRQLVAVLAALVILAGLFVLYFIYFIQEPSDGPAEDSQVAATEVPLGSIVPLSGDNMSLGEQVRDGQTIAVEELNSRANTKYKYRMVFKDSKGEKDTSKERVNELKKEGVDLIAELFGTASTLHCLKTIEERSMVLLSGVTTGAQLSARGGKYFFRIIPSDTVAVENLVRWAVELKLQRAAVVYLDDSWGQGLKEAFAEEYPRKKGTVALEVATVAKQEAFDETATALDKAKPDVVMLFINSREAGLLLAACAKLGMSTRFMGVDTLVGSEIHVTGGIAVEGVMYVVPQSPESPKASHFHKLYTEYRRRLGFAQLTKPPLYSVTGYDGVHVLAKAIEARGAKVESVISALESIDHLGASGRIEFSKNHDLKVTNPYARFEYAKGEGGIKAREAGTANPAQP